jgi:putative restriction endonuclease
VTPLQWGFVAYGSELVDRQSLIRATALSYVDHLSEHGERSVAWADLIGFRFEGERVPLVSQQGIFKPAALDLPMSIRTTYRAPGEERPYEDEVDESGFLLYRYRGTDPNHYQNQWLRDVMDRGLPLLYFAGVAKGEYMPSVASIIEDHPEALTFGVLLVTMDVGSIGTLNAAALDPATRRHYLAIVQQRVGQARFRETVLDAYSSKCTLCRLRHRELLDAAHIVPVAEHGSDRVTNGMSMCKIHHAAYDSDIVGVRPDGVAEVRRDVLEETDGPMLRHGLQEVHGVQLWLPRSPALQPSVEALEKRWERFRQAG